MKRITLFLLFLLLAISYSSIGQINDSFSDGEFAENLSWQGDEDRFIVNEANQLQLNANQTAGVASLSTTSAVILNAEWSFYIKLEFNPSSNNYIDIYLVSDQPDLKSPLKGYFVRVGDTEDEISLYRQSGEKSTSVKLIDGQDDRVDHSSVELRIKVTKNEVNEWELLVDSELNQQYISEGTTTDAAHYFSRYFGVVCHYTSTRSNKFYLDEVYISGEAYTDDIAPEVDSLIVLSDSSLQLCFSEKMLSSQLSNKGNYFVDNGIGSPIEAKVQSDSVAVLLFGNKFEDAANNKISIHNLQDLFGNAINNLVLEFSYIAPYVIGFGDIIITEIMADPSPGVDLPEYEYLEIHNPKDDRFTLAQVQLIVGADTAMIPDLVISSGEYLILCQHAATNHFQEYGRVEKVPNWPSLNNRGESIVLLNLDNEVVYSVDYRDSWYGSIDKDDGGYSLEMIDKTKPCLGMENWTAAADPNGGTPGRANAAQDELVDTSAPEISLINATSSKTIVLELSESIGPQKVDVSNLMIDPEIEIRNTALFSPGFSKIRIDFQEAIQPKTMYEVTLKNLADCSGNIQKGSTATFVLPEAADSLDLIINEILFNPNPGGVDFVEIYNRSDKFIDLSSILLGNNDLEPVSANQNIIQPRQFIAITEDAFSLQNQYPGVDMSNVITMLDMPSFNNDQGNVFLANSSGGLLDFFHYKEDFHSEFLNDPEGVSLERISYESASNDPDNWQSASSSSGYATPGAINSQLLISNVEDEEILIEPKVFIPGNHVYHSFTTIRCRFPSAGNMASILILDSTGKTVKTVLSHKSIGAQENFKWEGLDDQGRQVRIGPYIVHVEIYNVDGTKKLFRKKVVVGSQL